MNRHVDAEVFKHETAHKAADNALIESDRMIMLMDTTVMTLAALEYFENEKVAAINRQADRKLKEAAEEERVRKAAEDAGVAAAREVERTWVWCASAVIRITEEESDRLARAQATE